MILSLSLSPTTTSLCTMLVLIGPVVNNEDIRIGAIC